MSSHDTLKLELVEWRDANFSVDADNTQWDELGDDYINATVGWTKDTGRWVVIVSEITPGGERCITRVPQENVTARKRLSIGEDVERIEKEENPRIKKEEKDDFFEPLSARELGGI